MPSNFPSGAYEYGTLEVRSSGNSVTQTYSSHGNIRQVFTRTKWNANDWNAWKQIEDVEGSQAKVNTLKSGEIDPLKTRVATAESSITQQANLISQKVSQSDFNGQTFVSLINQTAQSIKIQAKTLSLKVLLVY
ncbi:hypothetical protein CIB87_00025 [Priestia megaterium]|uniref:Uncharacterized protein n=1 Tax=Priestia megaterium TaxID=1404 RepID=A0AA86LR02_PRIMG|nr:pyocin knob domain-containing protein [Priestia megaterium]AXI27480.1 hypothetical protein CIB87_00025 [Priestia megaterium]